MRKAIRTVSTARETNEVVEEYVDTAAAARSPVHKPIAERSEERRSGHSSEMLAERQHGRLILALDPRLALSTVPVEQYIIVHSPPGRSVKELSGMLLETPTG